MSLIISLKLFSQQTQEKSMDLFKTTNIGYSKENEKTSLTSLNKSLKGGWIKLKQLKNSIVYQNIDKINQKQLLKMAKAHLDRKNNKKNKDIEAFFEFIFVRDQKNRLNYIKCVTNQVLKDVKLNDVNWDNKELIDSCLGIYTIHKDDSLNILSYDSLINIYGWPNKKWVGKGIIGYNAFFMHLDFDMIEYRYLPEMKKIVNNNNQDFLQIDYYEDRLLLYKYCKPQKHNTITNYNWETKTSYIVEPKCNK